MAFKYKKMLTRCNLNVSGRRSANVARAPRRAQSQNPTPPTAPLGGMADPHHSSTAGECPETTGVLGDAMRPAVRLANHKTHFCEN